VTLIYDNVPKTIRNRNFSKGSINEKIFLSITIILTNYCVYVQNNTFPSTGFVGIGMDNPSEALTLWDSRIF